MPSLPLLSQKLTVDCSFCTEAEPNKLITDVSRVYVKYDVSNPPAHPGKGWTRFVCVSDTHGSTPNVPLGDVLIHAGDLTVYGSRKSFEATIAYLKNLPHPVKLVIAGNHDRMLDPVLYPDEIENYEYARDGLVGPEAVKSGVRYLQFQSLELSKKGPWRVYGSPATTWRNAGAFQYPSEDAVAVNSIIPRDTQILVTHGPPRGILDTNRSGKSAGCSALAARLFTPEDRPCPPRPQTPTSPSSFERIPYCDLVDSREECSADAWLPDVRLHVFGHIHEAYGAQIITRKPPLKSHPDFTASRRRLVETVFVNAAVQRPGSVPIIVDLFNVN